MVGTWKLLNTSTTGTGSTTISSGTFTASDYLRIIIYYHGIGEANPQVRFNNDSNSSNYYNTYRVSNSSNSTGNTQSSKFISYSANGTPQGFMQIQVMNLDNEEKLVTASNCEKPDTNASSAPNYIQWVGKYTVKSGQVTEVSLTSNGSNFGSESYISVYGASDDVVSDEKTTLTYVPANTRYEEIDTRKIYRFLGAETTPTFTESFTADNWTDADSGVAGVSTSNERLDFVAKADNTDDSTVYDFRGDQNFMSSSVNGAKQLDESANKYGIKLASNNPRLGQELYSIMFRMRKNNSPTGNVSAKIYKSDSTTATATSTNTLDVSTLHGSNFADKEFFFASGVTLESGDRIVVEGGSHDGTNQIKFEQNTSSFTDTVTIARFTSSWVDGISGDFRYLLTTRDQLVSETAWVLRWEYTRVSGGGSGNGHNHSFGLGKNNQDYHSGDATDAIYMAWGEPQNSGQSYMGIQALDGTTGNSNGHFPTSGSRVQNVDLTANKKYYMELKRESASKATFTVWSDEYGGTALSGFPVSNTSEVASSLADLQYIKWQNRGHDGVRSGTLTGYIENVKFYNGITSIPASGWKERGTA